MADILARVAALLPEVAAARDEAERQRRTPPGLAAKLTAAGAYQLYLPRAIGGPELPPLQAFRVVEALSRVDGSVGWCSMIAAAMSLNIARLPPEVGRELAGDPADYRAAGSARPGGPARAVPGGYRVSGRWNFASGYDNARWLYCTCVMHGDDGKPMISPLGKPVLRAVWIPRADTTMVDTWRTMGMRGTGSQDFVVDDVFVPERFSALSDAPPAYATPLYHRRAWVVAIWTPSAANALGIARGAIDALLDLAATEASTLSTQLLRDRPAVQARLGEADAIVDSARSYVFDAVGDLWSAVCGGREPTDRQVARARLSLVNAMHESARAVDKAFHAAGTNAIYSDGPLERAFRDIHVALQHGSAAPAFFESAGKALAGLRPDDPGW